MKKITIVIFIFITASCDMKSEKGKFDQKIKVEPQFEIVEIDGCEYITWKAYKYVITHKGNCKNKTTHR